MRSRTGRHPVPGARQAAAGRPRPATAGRGSTDRTARPPRPTGRPAGRAGRPTAPRRRPVARVRLGRPRRRLHIVGVLLALVLVVFTGRLVQIQALDTATYVDRAQSARAGSESITAPRGDITDRNGTVLATTRTAYDITADPTMFTEELTGDPDAPATAAALLAPILGTEAADLEALLRTPDTRYVRLAGQVDPQTWNQIRELRAILAEQSPDGSRNVLVGLFSEENGQREYPGGDLAASVLGYVSADGQGGGGLEYQLDDTLTGQDGRIDFTRAGAYQVPTAYGEESSAVPGSDVTLTLDSRIQWFAQQAITDRVAEAGAQSGYVIVQDTATGEILAMASTPGYDPGDLSSASSEQLRNPAVQDVYEPGSTAKLITMAAVLEEGVAAPDTHVTVPGTLRRADRVFHDDVEHDTWHLTLAGVLAKSSNIGTILAAEQLGDTQAEANEVLHDYLTRFGLGQQTGLGFPGESPGLLAAPEQWNASQQYTIPFGQGLSLNAVQATSVFSTVANGGVRVEPTLVSAITGPDGRVQPAPEPERTRVISEETADTLMRMLETVVHDEEGTGTRASIPGYRIGGKTGTANRVDDSGSYNGYTASFIGVGPVDNPRLTVSCTIQDPVGDHYGGSLCGPVFKDVMEFALKTLRIPPSGEAPSDMPVTW
ncbi:peptidoglycan D,D-transpeptidase FtsI family protein [Allostreptomyces psammosilenae]|uniref:peptidoglycan D,D-transpeptidase FtsI family protein n=1 Tax=Allostreptomyces psammosilenae TaxID=1892865 RepID=UPI001C549510